MSEIMSQETGLQDAEAPPASSFGISDAAAKRIAFLAEQDQTPGLMLRVAVHGGGCSGFRYAFDFDTEVNADDRTFSHDGTGVVIDEVSLELLAGSELHYVEDLIGSYFEIRNPNANSSCGCGASFSI